MPTGRPDAQDRMAHKDRHLLVSKTPHSRYVAYFDILGMKEVTNADLKEAWGVISDLREATQQALKLVIVPLLTSAATQSSMIRDRVRARRFSDTVILYSLRDEPQDLWAILILSTQLFVNGLSRCVPLRGAISFGQFVFNEQQDLYAGPPLVNACQMADNAHWSGIVVDSHVAQSAQALPFLTIEKKPAIVTYPVPRKNDVATQMNVINWPTIHRRGFKKVPFSVEEYYEAFGRMFGPYGQLPPDVQQKYENTVEFIHNQLGVPRID